MKLIVSVLLIILLSAVACLFLPWWSIALAAFAVSALVPQSPMRSFLAGFLALFLFWAVLSWFISANNNHILAHRIAVLFLKTDSPAFLVIVTALIGGLVAGTAALTGSFLHPRRIKDDSVAV